MITSRPTTISVHRSFSHLFRVFLITITIRLFGGLLLLRGCLRLGLMVLRRGLGLRESFGVELAIRCFAAHSDPGNECLADKVSYRCGCSSVCFVRPFLLKTESGPKLATARTLI